ncbi:hypothetical protein, partial [Arthrobacter sp. JCM 19049]|uniref:hypothetical protein n=1 Tax=Arthrobacter sp. JCM 19049 TaxID=1460643 RepID=UPI002436C2A4
ATKVPAYLIGLADEAGRCTRLRGRPAGAWPEPGAAPGVPQRAAAGLNPHTGLGPPAIRRVVKQLTPNL